jgi:hypothetical protein
MGDGETLGSLAPHSPVGLHSQVRLGLPGAPWTEADSSSLSSGRSLLSACDVLVEAPGPS